jgi:tRNA threonylcarbamoyladenosine biosynthesis protein TsaB
MPQIALALNTTTEVLELAIAQVNPLSYLKHSEWNLGRELSVQIHTCLDRFMQGYDWNALAFVAIASGVGSFTGTRIGMVLARTLGEQLNIPVYAVSCMDMLNYHSNSNHTQLIFSLANIGHDRWLQNDFTHWSEALPLYT